MMMQTLVGCRTTGETGEFHKIDDIMSLEQVVEILQEHLKSSVRMLKVGHNLKQTIILSIQINELESALVTTKRNAS